MRILLINPQIPEKFWSFKYAVEFISRTKKAENPPLGLLTIAAMLPESWEVKLLDMNVEKVRDRDIRWSDYVLISAVASQAESADQLIDRVQAQGRRVIACGPYFTDNFQRYNHVDHLVLNEAELSLPEFIAGYDANWPWRVYRSDEYFDMTASPIPDYSLINIKHYSQLSIEYSRGCPNNCEHCGNSHLYGGEVRTKNAVQVLLELDNIYDRGYRGSIFLLDDNFVCNTTKLKKELLPALIKWNRIHRMPFTFTTEASTDLSDDKELMNLMAKAGFVKVFVGMESTDDELLYDCDKRFIINRNLVLSISNIRKHGLEVFAG